MNEEKLAQYLKLCCKGRANTKRSDEIERAVGLSGNELRKLVNRMRRRGVPIGSSRRGYFYAVTAGDVYSTIRQLREATKRLEDAVIENKDAVKLILDRDRPDGLIYCDPPYYDAEQYYDAVFSTEDHLRLHDALKECNGYVIVSYNNCEEIRKLYSDFYHLSFARQNPMAQQAGVVYEELLMTNYDLRPFAG